MVYLVCRLWDWISCSNRLNAAGVPKVKTFFLPRVRAVVCAVNILAHLKKASAFKGRHCRNLFPAVWILAEVREGETLFLLRLCYSPYLFSLPWPLSTAAAAAAKKRQILQNLVLEKKWYFFLHPHLFLVITGLRISLPWGEPGHNKKVTKRRIKKKQELCDSSASVVAKEEEEEESSITMAVSFDQNDRER